MKLPFGIPTDKEQFKWWVEDNKSKAIGLLVGAIVCVFVVFLLISSLFEKAPLYTEPEWSKYEEIVMEGFDIQEEIQKQEDTKEDFQQKKYGYLFTLMPSQFVYDEKRDFYLIPTMEENGNTFYLYADNTTFEGGNLSAETLNGLSNNSSLLTYRGNFEDIDPAIIDEWEAQNYRDVVMLFTDTNFNKTTAKEWTKHLEECLVARGYSKKDTAEDMTPEEWDEIIGENYIYFESYLAGLYKDEASLNSKNPKPNPLDAYLAENPLPGYGNIKVATTPMYICDMDNVAFAPLTNANYNLYINSYWDTYYKNASEIFINENDDIDISSLTEGISYKIKKPANFNIYCDKSNEGDIVVWYRDENMNKIYHHFIGEIWIDYKSYDAFYTFSIPSGAKYFGFNIVGNKYKIDNTMDVSIPYTNQNGEVTTEKFTFSVSDTIRYTKSDLTTLGTINLSDIIYNESNSYTMPEGYGYIKNNTNYYIELDSQGDSCTIEPGKELYVTEIFRTFTFKVN